jgi:predicted nucleic acid-binding Zn ribbon protein
LSRTETLILWQLGRLIEAATCFEGLVRLAASQRDWEKEEGYGDYPLYKYEEDLSAFATLWQIAGNDDKKCEILQVYEQVTRTQGYWNSSVIEYYFRDMFTEMERVCREEDELDVAAHLYERAGKTDDSARILEEIGRLEAGIAPAVTDRAEYAKQEDKLETKTAARKCPACGAEVPTGDSFCSDCGHRLERVCSDCGGAIEEHRRFCGKCGAKIS